MNVRRRPWIECKPVLVYTYEYYVDELWETATPLSITNVVATKV